MLESLRLIDGIEAALPNGASQELHAIDTIRGGARELARHGTNEFAIHSRWTLDEGAGRRRAVGHEIQFGVGQVIRVLAERIVDGARDVIVESDREGSSVLHIDVNNRPPVADLLSIVLHLVHFVDARPERMRHPSPNLHEAWWGVWYSRARHRRPEARESAANFLEWASEASGSMGLRALGVSEDDDGMMFVLIDRDERRIPGRGLSDATLRCFGIFTSLLCAKPGTIVCLDDAAAGLDSRRARLLVELFDRVYRDRGIQVIATMHDASLLRWLDDEHVGQAVLLARDPERPGSSARRLGDLPGFFEAKRSLGLDEMLATAWLESAMWG